MTEKEKAEKIAEQIKETKKKNDARKALEIKEGFLNPFGEQTSYAEFLSEVEKSKKSIADYCKDKITAEELAWLSIEIEHFKNNQKD